MPLAKLRIGHHRRLLVVGLFAPRCNARLPAVEILSHDQDLILWGAINVPRLVDLDNASSCIIMAVPSERMGRSWDSADVLGSSWPFLPGVSSQDVVDKKFWRCVSCSISKLGVLRSELPLQRKDSWLLFLCGFLIFRFLWNSVSYELNNMRYKRW